MDNGPKMTKYDERSPERVKQRFTVAPRVDVYENANELLLVADMPGATKESVSIQLDKGQVTIEASRAEDMTGPSLVSEYRPTDYARVFSIPQGIDASKIDAQLSGGVLRLRLPKSDALKPRRIEVRSS
ncbi:MAG TPA: Hsp20/alpha crystallin family protein [Polyangiaceae bacterium]|nr:Hsp20/alpha crystallin family protein [Polyangiaceae bacterium]